jgi:DNA repair exonuclease SbcCD ATPase subunit
MITFKNISFKNFMSFGSQATEIPLNDSKSTLILGKNLDVGNEGESANGVGKTAYIQAIVFSIFGKGIDKMKTDEFINLRNGKKLEVCLDFEKDGIEYRIERCRKPNRVSFFVDGQDVTRDTMKNTDEDILKAIDIPYEIFIRSIFMSPHIDSFLAMTPAEQRNYVEEVLSLDVLASRADVLKNVIRKEISDEVKLLDRDIENAVTTNDKIEKSIIATKEKSENFVQNTQRTIDDIKQNIKDLPVVDDDVLGKLTQLEHYRVQAKEASDIAGIYGVDLSKENAELQRIEDLVDRYASLVEKEEKHDDASQQAVSGLEEQIAKLPRMDVLEQAVTTNKGIEESKKLQQQTVLPLDQFTRKESDIKAKLEDAKTRIESLESGKCPYCEQSHIDAVLLEKEKKQQVVIEESLMEIKNEIAAIDDKVIKIIAEYAVFYETFDSIVASDGEEVANNPEKFITQHTDITNKLQNARDNNKNVYSDMLVEFEEKHGGVEGIEAKLEETIQKVQDLERGKERSEVIADDFETSINAIIESTGFSEKKDAEQISQKADDLQKRIEEEEKKENPYHETIADYQKMMVDITELEEQKRESDKVLTHVNYLIKLLTNPKSFIRKNIVDRYIPFVNKKMNEYAEQLGLSHVIEIQSDMTVSMEYMTNSVSYFMMSRGERLRANVAASIAFRDLMNLLGRSSNLLLVDELLDGSADAFGMNAIFNMIKATTDEVFIVSHREEFKDSVDRQLVISKSNGFSDIEWVGR